LSIPGQPVAASNDKTTLWGVLGIVFALCCPIVGIIFAVLSMMEAKKSGKPQTLAYVGFVIAGLNIVVGIILSVSGNFPGM
jgi:threonine/homoserine/homoserine lactone efflux protein